MSLEVAIQENTAALNRLLAALADLRSSPVVVPPVSAPAASTHPEKPAPSKTDNLPVDSAHASASETQPAAAIPQKADVSKFFVEKFAPSKGREAAVAVLTKYGVKKVSEIPEGDQRLADLLTEIKAAVGA